MNKDAIDQQISGKGAFLRKPLETEVMQQIQSYYNEYLNVLQPVYDAVSQRLQVDNAVVKDLVKHIIQHLEGFENETRQFMLYGLQGSSGFLQKGI